jgi:hypothetical protein
MMEIKWEIKWEIKRNRTPVSIYHYTVTIALVSEPPINLGNVRGLYN